MIPLVHPIGSATPVGLALAPVGFISNESGVSEGKDEYGIVPRLASALAGVVTSNVHEMGMVDKGCMEKKGPLIAPPTRIEWLAGSMVMVGSQASTLFIVSAYWIAFEELHGTAPPPPAFTLSILQMVEPSGLTNTNLYD